MGKGVSELFFEGKSGVDLTRTKGQDSTPQHAETAIMPISAFIKLIKQPVGLYRHNGRAHLSESAHPYRADLSMKNTKECEL